mmetsp:Transcript_57566/g.135136  ORF Transcript_57566/g.135136 Transcript_57566/m.135136 type:complete len:202 (-) Transcript_57566:273-878(-)
MEQAGLLWAEARCEVSQASREQREHKVRGADAKGGCRVSSNPQQWSMLPRRLRGALVDVSSFDPAPAEFPPALSLSFALSFALSCCTSTGASGFCCAADPSDATTGGTSPPLRTSRGEGAAALPPAPSTFTGCRPPVPDATGARIGFSCGTCGWLAWDGKGSLGGLLRFCESGATDPAGSGVPIGMAVSDRCVRNLRTLDM